MSASAPSGCHVVGRRLKTGPRAKPRAGNAAAAAAMAPAPWAAPVMRRRRVTVSPANAPGRPASEVERLTGISTMHSSTIRCRCTPPPARRSAGTSRGTYSAGCADEFGRPARSSDQSIREERSAMLREFSARLQKGEGKGAWTYVVMDGSARFFGTKGLVKVRGAIDGEPFESAFMALGDGTHKLPVKAAVRKAINKEAGDTVVVRLDERIG